MRNILGFINYPTRFVSLFTVAVWGFCSISFAQPYVYQNDPVSQPVFTDLKKTSEGVVEKILGPYTILLSDTQVIKLNGIECLGYNPIDQSTECIQAYEKLKEILPKGSRLSLFQTLNSDIGRVNRMDEMLVHAVLEGNSKKLWVQGMMLQEGLYRVRTTKYSPEVADIMYNLEHTARLSQVGIWAKKGGVVRTANDITPQDTGFSIVEGEVQKVARVRNDVYLNFGDNWKTDFTIGVPSALVRQFNKNGINLNDLSNKSIRVRGWVRDYNGPYIELSHMQQLEIAPSSNTGDVTTLPSAPPSLPAETSQRQLSPLEKIIEQSKKTNSGFGHMVVTQEGEAE